MNYQSFQIKKVHKEKTYDNFSLMNFGTMTYFPSDNIGGLNTFTSAGLSSEK